jgi:hypothetical protein
MAWPNHRGRPLFLDTMKQLTTLPVSTYGASRATGVDTEAADVAAHVEPQAGLFLDL